MIRDQMGREVHIPLPARRVVSLVPSITEYLVDLGVEVVGRTKFCVHPGDHVKCIPVIGGTKKFRFGAIAALKPDLIVGNKEENDKEGISTLEKDFPVWMSDIETLEDAYEMMEQLGDLFGKSGSARDWIAKVQASMEAVKASRTGRVIYLIWKDPWMAAGPGTFINSILRYMGYQNAVREGRYPVIEPDKAFGAGVDRVLLSSEPYPFREKHLEELRRSYPGLSVELVDGEAYSWYGSRMAKVAP